MGRLSDFSAKFLVLALTAGSATLPAWSQAQAPAPSLLAPKQEKSATTIAPQRARPVSAGVAAQLAAAAPKFAPAPPKAEAKPEEEVDAREVDKPRNNIIRLPKYIVQEAKPPVFNERAIHTKEGLKDLAMRRYISDIDRALNRFSLPLFSGWSPGGGGSSTERRALAMYAEQERLDNIAYLQDAAHTASKSDPDQGAYILRASQETYLRTTDFGWQSRDPAKR